MPIKIMHARFNGQENRGQGFPTTNLTMRSTDTQSYTKTLTSASGSGSEKWEINKRAGLVVIAKSTHSRLLLLGLRSKPYPNSEAQETFVVSRAFALLAHASRLTMHILYKNKKTACAYVKLHSLRTC